MLTWAETQGPGTSEVASNISRLKENAAGPEILVVNPEQQTDCLEDDAPTPTLPGLSLRSALAQASNHSLCPALEKQEPRSRASSLVGTLTIVDTLRDKLRDQKCEEKPWIWFVPVNAQDAIIDKQTIIDYISFTNPSQTTRASEYAELILQHAKRLFAALVMIRKGAEICSLLDEKVHDKDLPFKSDSDGGQFQLQTRAGHTIKGLGEWSKNELEKLLKYQWRMTAPVFKEYGEYVFDKHTILPFLSTTDADTDKSIYPEPSGYSDVSRVCIHPAHHNFSGTHEKVVRHTRTLVDSY